MMPKMREGSPSDDEWTARTFRNTKQDGPEVKPEDILKCARDEGLDFSKHDSDGIKAFDKQHKETLKKQERRRVVDEPGNILHVLATESAPKGELFAHWTEERLSNFLGWFLDRYWDFLDIPIKSSLYFQLHTAFSKYNHEFIRIVLRSREVTKLGKVLVQKSKHLNYIQIAVRRGSPFVEDIARKCTDLALPVWHGSESFGKGSETPLHEAVKRVYSNEVDQALRDQLDVKTDSEESGPIVKWDMLLEQIKKGEDSDDKFVLNTPNDLADLLLHLIERNRTTQDSMSQIDTVKLFIELSENTLKHQARWSMELNNEMSTEVRATPYQFRITKLREKWDHLVTTSGNKSSPINQETCEKAFRRVVIEDPVADTIRYHCLRYYKRDEIVQCLYQPGDERHIDFDLAGLPNPSITKAFLERLARHLQFERILKSKKTTRRTLLDLREVFQWLRVNQVRRIIKVTVIDDRHLCHSDEVIEEALAGFQVEVWDWKKVDLCTNVIWSSTKVARHISLYSSCSNAVLMGWAGSGGLGDRKKFPQLEHVHLFIAKGHETSERRARYIKEFKDKIRAIEIPDFGKKNKNVTVQEVLDDGKVSYAPLISDLVQLLQALDIAPETVGFFNIPVCATYDLRFFSPAAFLGGPGFSCKSDVPEGVATALVTAIA